MHLLDGVWHAVKLCCHIMKTVQWLKTEMFVAAYLVFPMASMVAGEASCKYYAKMFEAKEMECFLSRDGQDPVCKPGDVSREHCHIRTRQQHMCVKWLVTTSITCWNNTYWKEMEGIDQDCAADQDNIIPPACPRLAPGSPPQWPCPEHLQREASRRHPYQIPKPRQLTPFNAEGQRFYFEVLLNN